MMPYSILEIPEVHSGCVLSSEYAKMISNGQDGFKETRAEAELHILENNLHAC